MKIKKENFLKHNNFILVTDVFENLLVKLMPVWIGGLKGSAQYFFYSM